MDIIREMIQPPNIEAAFVKSGVSSGSIFFNSKSLDSAIIEPRKLKKILSKGERCFTLLGRIFNTSPTLAWAS